MNIVEYVQKLIRFFTRQSINDSVHSLARAFIFYLLSKNFHFFFWRKQHFSLYFKIIFPLLKKFF